MSFVFEVYSLQVRTRDQQMIMTHLGKANLCSEWNKLHQAYHKTNHRHQLVTIAQLKITTSHGSGIRSHLWTATPNRQNIMSLFSPQKLTHGQQMTMMPHGSGLSLAKLHPWYMVRRATMCGVGLLLQGNLQGHLLKINLWLIQNYH